jgi:hypothetical protein
MTDMASESGIIRGMLLNYWEGITDKMGRQSSSAEGLTGRLESGLSLALNLGGGRRYSLGMGSSPRILRNIPRKSAALNFPLVLSGLCPVSGVSQHVSEIQPAGLGVNRTAEFWKVSLSGAERISSFLPPLASQMRTDAAGA